MALDVTWINRTRSLLDGNFGEDRHAQYLAVGRLYNTLLGPVTKVNLLRPEVTDLPLLTSSCRHASVGELFPDLSVKQTIADSVIIPGGGKGLDAQTALVGGLGEIAERLLAVLHFAAVHDRLEFSTYDRITRLGRRALAPEALPLFSTKQYSDPQFPYQRFRADTPLRWVTGTDVATGESISVPAQLVLLYYKHHPDEARIGYPTTGGLAFHSDPRLALLHGIFEVIERDAVNVTWYRRIPPHRVAVDLSTVGSSHERWPTRWNTPDLPEVEVYLNQTDLPVPVFTTLAVDRSRTRRALLGGGGADPSRLVALTQALFELGQTRTSLKYYQPLGLKRIVARSLVSEMTDFFDSAIYYGYVENLPILSWYRETPNRISWDEIEDHSFGSPDETLAWVFASVRAAGLDIIAFDFGGACWPGVTVTKVLIPQLTQACVPSHPYHGHPRFSAGRLGPFTPDDAYADLNPYPVPFP